MRIIGITYTMLVSLVAPVASQSSYLSNPDLLDKVEYCLDATYGFRFERAREILHELKQDTPGHPAPLFLNALIVYWENFPLIPQDEESEKFLNLLDRVVHAGEEMSDNQHTYLEGVFFDLFGRSFQAMFWSDNGKPAKVVPDLATMYRHTLEGFRLQEQFSEFYFSTGLYNYYVEAFPEKHPVYKPLVSFMKPGDKRKGLMQLNQAIKQSTFLRVESLLFMSLIQLKYEEDLHSAILYARRLYREFPRNIYYQGHLITILLYKKRFPEVKEMLTAMAVQDNIYSTMVEWTAEGFIAEYESGDTSGASEHYRKALQTADQIGDFANMFKAICYMGLSRINARNGKVRAARQYHRMASDLTNYGFITGD